MVVVVVSEGLTMVTVVGMTIETNPPYANSKSGREVSEEGSSIVMREVQSRKQLDPMAVTVVGTMIEAREVHDRNAACPMDMTDRSITTLTAGHDRNAAL